MEAKYWHLPVTPFHGGLREVKGKVDGFTELKEKRRLINALMRMESQVTNFIDNHLKGCIFVKII
ncbi:hypothetical protein D4S03_07145 [bacterium]|nr:MAG: hypothetical protein D4S03_07145 [bacterium]